MRTELQDWLQLLEGRHPKAIDLGLDRCRAVWERMGAPQPASKVFVVAGTNGKGSTAAAICSLLRALGYRQGSYTTPHLYVYNERVQLAGRPVGDEALLEAFERVEAARGEVSLTYFEFGTLAAFEILSRASLDFAVMEVGLGGRLDAVNLLDADCAVITPIGLDHQEFLGDDLEAIGHEKAGIMRPRRPVICGEANPPASVLEAAAGLGAPLRRFGVDFGAEATAGGMRFCSAGFDLDAPRPSLAGPHQIGNMATALAAVLELCPDAAPESLERGLRSVELPGRFERLQHDPPVWLDVGHNALAARAVAGALREAIRAGDANRCRCVIGMLADKDAAAAAAELTEVITAWYCAGLPGVRGRSGAALARQLRVVTGATPLAAHDSVNAALSAALADCDAGDAVLVFGSFLTAAAAGRVLTAPEPDTVAG